jgi:hypothetical protein
VPVLLGYGSGGNREANLPVDRFKFVFSAKASGEADEADETRKHK